MTKKGKIQQIRNQICIAKAAQHKADLANERLFNLLSEYKVNLEVQTKAENVEDLNEAICSYIDYDEYDIDKLLNEIENAMEEE